MYHTHILFAPPYIRLLPSVLLLYQQCVRVAVCSEMNPYRVRRCRAHHREAQKMLITPVCPSLHKSEGPCQACMQVVTQ